MLRIVLIVAALMATVASGHATPQRIGQEPDRRVPVELPKATRDVIVTPFVLSGDDIGFRVERDGPNGPIGRIVVRIDGQWVEAQLVAGPAQAK